MPALYVRFLTGALCALLNTKPREEYLELVLRLFAEDVVTSLQIFGIEIDTEVGSEDRSSPE